MSSSQFDKTQTQYERKLARQKQLDMMEAAASGQEPGEEISVASGESRGSGSEAPPAGAIESARRFLWDEDDVPASGDLYRGPPAYDMYGNSDSQHQGLMDGAHTPIAPPRASSAGEATIGSRIMGSLPRWTARTGLEGYNDDETGRKNLAPRRPSAFGNNAGSIESEEYISSERGCLSCISDIFMRIIYMVTSFLSLLCEYMTACVAQVSPRLVGLAACLILGLSLFIFACVAIAHRSKDGKQAGTAPIGNMERYDSLRNIIIESGFTAQHTIDSSGTAQDYALRWLTDNDPAMLETDDDAILQRYALAVFYFSTYVYSEILDAAGSGSGGKGGWIYMDYWMSDKGICEWFGVSCPPHLHEGVEVVHYNENSDVLRLNLTDNALRGKIPSELVALENLISLDLGNNELSGTVPTSFGGFQELRELYLEDNNLSGTIHTEYGGIKNLRDFFLGTNKFTGTIPDELGNLSELRAVGLDENALTGKIPNIWGATNLLILYLDDNQLSGTIASEIANLSELMDVRLRKNALTGTIPEDISKLTHLELLYLDDNNLTGSIPATWETMDRMTEIQLYKNKLTGALPVSISSLTDLKVLYLDNNNLRGTIPESYGNLADLSIFYAFNNAFSGTLPTTIGNLGDLTDFQFYNNKIKGPLPSELGNCYKLKKLEAQDNDLTGKVPTEFGNLEALEMMKLYRNDLTGSIPEAVCDAKNNFMLNFMAVDCNADAGGKLECDCCNSNSCYP